jgi:hypothetical protein
MLYSVLSALMLILHWPNKNKFVLQIYNSLIGSVLQYASCAWQIGNKDNLDKLIPFHSSTLFTHIPFPLTYAFYAYPFPPDLRILRILLHHFFEHKYRRIKSLCCKSCTS